METGAPSKAVATAVSGHVEHDWRDTALMVHMAEPSSQLLQDLAHALRGLFH
jgi:hypothetical protein